MKNTHKSNSICLIGLDCYPVLTNSSSNDYIGGESVQISLLAKSFAELGYDVSIICGDYGQPAIEMIDGIRVIRAFKAGTGFPIIRFLYRRIYCFMKALKIADSKIYFQSCSGYITGLVALHCQLSKNDKTFIFRVASDADCIPNQHISTNYWQRALYNYGLKKANIVSVQSTTQQDLLYKNYNINSTPINMIVEEPSLHKDITKDIDLIWIGNIRKVKRPELLFEIAHLLPNYKFLIIGGPLPGEEDYYNEVKIKADRITNIIFKGFIPYHEVGGFFERAKILINTSEIEGFPNTFLQAWIRKTPVISFFDPDNIIKNEKLGDSPIDIEDMKNSIENILNNKDELSEVGTRCESFAKNNYSSIAVANKYISIINKQSTDIT